MRRIFLTLIVLLFPAVAFAQATNDFASKVNVEPLKSVIVQHNQTLKTLDSFARQSLYTITGKTKLDGQEPLFTVLDMALNKEKYVAANIVKVKNVPLRQDVAQQIESLTEAERSRIIKEGKVSLDFWFSPQVQQLLNQLESSAVHKSRAIQEAQGAAATLANLGAPNFPVLRVIAPATGEGDDHVWHNLDEIAGNVPAWSAAAKTTGQRIGAPLVGYGEREKLLPQIGTAFQELLIAWRSGDAATVNQTIQTLATLLPQTNPSVYPSEARRSVEIVYNRMAKMTIPGAALYFVAFACFLMSARSGVGSLRLWGLRLMVLGFLIHTAGIGIRWWLVAGQHGNWFDGIPIKNQFESVLFSAWFGCLLGLILEIWKSRGAFGAAASFVGWMSLIAIFATPYVLGKEIGGEIGQVNGVLMSYWLYIHVTLVVASYALIGMSFLLSIWWLVAYFFEYDTLRRVPSRQLSVDNTNFDAVPEPVSTGGAGGGAVALTFAQTLAMMLFVPQPKVKAARATAKTEAAAEEGAKNLLRTLDLCNLVILQLAFWVLGVGIICGAIWADQSWGRPWGWDPKETFALVTWIVYLIVVHVRVATDDKAWWTSLLSIVGFFVMLFNWIGVNFFLVGLHSYA